MLSIVHKGIAIPIYWELLDKRGNSNSIERIELIQQFIEQFGKDKIDCILADREFIGKDWFEWLDKENISFCIRIKKNNKIPNHNGEMVQAHQLFRNVSKHETFILGRIVTIHGCNVRLTARRNNKNELVIVASNHFSEFQAIELYAKRWEIETLFSCFKGRGFNLEDTHLTNQDRMKKLVAIFSIAFCWCYKIGIQQNKETPIKLKNHDRPSMSLFRLGLNVFHETIRQVVFFAKPHGFNYLLEFLIVKKSLESNRVKG